MSTEAGSWTWGSLAPCKESADETRAVAKTTIHRLLSRRDIPLQEKTLWRMLYETAARAAEVLALNVEDLDLEHRRAPVCSKGGTALRHVKPGAEAIAKVAEVMAPRRRTH
ncbi:tyrosine-type recombinase/integrase [Nonomuraea angiospora]|uniref:tyrosine-type recombinase/integrase n=1 Tax=Nonomuraea angiospora TaxID=46172 RepID=UPI00344FE32A